MYSRPIVSIEQYASSPDALYIFYTDVFLIKEYAIRRFIPGVLYIYTQGIFDRLYICFGVHRISLKNYTNSTIFYI